jgi:catechol 2,3-dioxygenase-like lactoylglutathione lyase family enzyme
MLQAIDHVNLVVRDLGRLEAFYQSALGLKITKRVTISGEWIDRTVGLSNVRAQVVYLELPAGPRIELIRYDSPPSPDASADAQSPNATGPRHIAFRVDGIDELVERLRNAGVEFFSQVQTVPDSQVTYTDGVRKRLVYFRDPEGNILELCEYR